MLHLRYSDLCNLIVTYANMHRPKKGEIIGCRLRPLGYILNYSIFALNPPILLSIIIATQATYYNSHQLRKNFQFRHVYSVSNDLLTHRS